MSLTFIASTPSGAATRTVSAKDRRKIRSQVMKTSWGHKKGKKRKSVRFVDVEERFKVQSRIRGFWREAVRKHAPVIYKTSSIPSGLSNSTI